jgi:Tol biopolymer transport system component
MKTNNGFIPTKFMFLAILALLNTSGFQPSVVKSHLSENYQIFFPMIWAPGRIVYRNWLDGFNEIYYMNADGLGQTRVTHDYDIDCRGNGNFDPSWSPDRKRIVYSSTCDGFGEIYIINIDGTNKTRLTFTTDTNEFPAWSPDGTKIAFDNQIDILVMNVDGTGIINLTPIEDGAIAIAPAWSSDGTKIVFSQRDLCGYLGCDLNDIYIMNADGTGVKQLTQNINAQDYDPHLSPDGSKIVFFSGRDTTNYDIFVMNADGSQITNLTNVLTGGFQDISPTWSPDGKQIAFESYLYPDGPTHIFVMNTDGTNLVDISNSEFSSLQPCW